MEPNEELTTQPEPTLREMLADNLANVEEPAVKVEPEKVEPEKPVEAQEPEKKPGKTAGRPRDEHGRLLPGKPVIETPEPVVETVPAIKRPSTWKKEHWGDFDQLATANPKLADYINQRESEYAKGVSTYKNEWEGAKPLIDAVTPYVQTIQQHGLNVHDVVARTLQAHHTLSLAQPQEKLAMLQQLARDYQIPAQLAVQDAQGNWQLLGQQPQRQAPQQQFDPAALDRIIEEKLLTRQSLQTVAEFESNAPEHYAVVKQDMAGLLQAGLADDLQGAYEAAIRLPKHADIFNAIQEQERQKIETEQRQANKAKVTRARTAAVGIRSSTPSGTAQQQTDKGLRETIAENLAAVGSGRV